MVLIEPLEKKDIDLRLPVAPQIYDIVRQQIIRNELTPGSRISEAELASGFNVSRQPVREAFIKLTNDGLLYVLPNRGSFVRKISINAVLDARFVREAIEADIVKLLAADHDAALDRELNSQIKHQTKAVRADDPDAFIHLDELFHQTLAEAAQKSGAWAVVQSQKAQMDRVRYLSLIELDTSSLLEQHQAIVTAIATNDAAAAEAAMRSHLRKIIIDLPAIAQVKPELFEPGDG
ncbi:GntR family transcriptional regulator [Cohaesibacter celericrescens]|uniref:GntR family transcriptional regulator n=1 Tax=Cohaesibacter celericrescens TaxID=2067669 RepID=A0A2N5XMG7_9HYPH|nr:GntR family transcriptional regulator [Cohaesibacter celericrescens]PLW75726.1 GntR family transcriptional regulator [Cohaesibacter celericrescens]